MQQLRQQVLWMLTPEVLMPLPSIGEGLQQQWGVVRCPMTTTAQPTALAKSHFPLKSLVPTGQAQSSINGSTP